VGWGGGEFVEMCFLRRCFHDDYFKVGEVEVFHEGFELRCRRCIAISYGAVVETCGYDEEYHFRVLVLYLVLCCVVLCCVVLCGYVLYREYFIVKLITQSLNHSIRLKQVNGG
jgi:hypothetical protein